MTAERVDELVTELERTLASYGFQADGRPVAKTVGDER